MSEAKENGSEESANSAIARVLSVIVSKGVVEGRDLHYETSVDEVTLTTAAAELIKRGFIDVKGNFRDPEEVLFAHFALRPSAERKAQKFLEEYL